MLDGLEAAWDERWAPTIHGALDAWSTFDLPGVSLEKLIAHCDAGWQSAHGLWAIHFKIVMPLGRGWGAFVELYGELFEPDGVPPAHVLLQGIDTLTTMSGRRLWALRHVALR